jgi:hypothetical protein
LAKVIEKVEACYEVEKMEFGTLYRWCPESVVIECDCRQSFTIKGAKDAACPRCGADYSGGVGRGLASKPLTEEEAYRLTRRDYEAWIKEEGSHRSHSERLYAGGLLSGLAAEINRILEVLFGS